MPPMSAKQTTTSKQWLFVLLTIGGIVNNHCLEVVVCFADIGGIVNNHCLEVVVCFADIGGIVNNHCHAFPISLYLFQKKLYERVI
jgi:hypothetical protein